MPATEQLLLEEGTRIARGRSSVEPQVHHLIAMDLRIVALEERVDLLLRTIGMLDQLHPDELEKRLS